MLSTDAEASERVRKVTRLRSARATAAALVATVVLVVAGALLYDAIAVRAGQPARRWRAQLADELAVRHLDDLWVLVGAGASVLIGGWLLWLAFAPGLRRWLVLRPYGGTAAAIERAGVGHLLADRVAGEAGIERLRIKVGRRRVRVSVSGLVDPAGVQRQLREELARVGLARPLRLDVRSWRGSAGVAADGVGVDGVGADGVVADGVVADGGAAEREKERAAEREGEAAG